MNNQNKAIKFNIHEPNTPIKRHTMSYRFGREIKKNYVLYIMALPAISAFLIFNYAPMIGLVMAFQELDMRKGLFRSPFAGFRNFEFLFRTTDAWRITRNTIAYNVVFIILGLFLAILVAILLNEITSKRLAKTIQTIFIMPKFLSMAVVAIVVFAFLHSNYGYINKLLISLGKEPQYWYNYRKPWPYILVVVHLWKGVGYSSVIYLAAISGISLEYYEAAVLDGASKLQQALYITIPHLRAMASILLIMSIGGIFRGDFGLFYVVTQNSGRLYPVTDVLDTYIYRAMTTLQNPGMASAAGFYQSIVSFFCIILANKIVEKIEPDHAMF